MPDTAPFRSIHIRHSIGSYDVSIGSCLHRAGDLTRAALPQARRAAIIVDPYLQRITPHLIDAAIASLRAANLETHVIIPGLGASTRSSPWVSAESNKTLQAVESMTAALSNAGIDRRDFVVAIGGGLLTDLAGLAAALYRRGVAWIPVPTTLLAMVDASVGGKTAANLTRQDDSHAGSLLKNMVGIFHQPSLVLVDPSWLITLDQRQIASGLAECIKHSMITGSVIGASASSQGSGGGGGGSGSGGGGGPDVARASIDRFRASPQGAIALLESNIALKARVVEQDEFERAPDAIGGRALLNLGHTFGHAIEALGSRADTTMYPATPIQHGEAVGLGLIAATHAAAALNMIAPAHCDTVRATIAHANLPTTFRSSATIPDMIALMQHDKKTLANALRVILPTGQSTAKVVASPDPSVLAAAWHAVLE